MTTITTRDARASKRFLVLACGGALLTLAVVAAGLWQLGGRGERETSVSDVSGETGVAPAVVRQTVPDGVAGASSIQELGAPPAMARPADDTPVSDQEMYPRWLEGTSATSVGPARIGRADQRLSIYLVDSQEQADRVRAALDDGDAILATLGQSVWTQEVTVIGSAAEEMRLREGIYESDGIRAGLGLPVAEVIDLRTRPEVVTPPAEATVTEEGPGNR